MSLFTAALIALIVWILIKYFITPYTKKSTFRKSAFSQLAKISWMVILNYLQKIAFFAAVCYGLIGLLFVINSWIYKSNPSENFLNPMFEKLIALNSFLTNFNTLLFLLAFAILAIIFIFILNKNAKRYVYNIYNDVYEKYEKNEITAEPSTERMRQLEEEIVQSNRKLESLRALNPNTLNTSEKKRREKIIEEVQNYIYKLQFVLKEEDVKRYIIPEIENKSNAKSKRSWWQGLVTFFTSQGMVRTVYSGSKWIGNTGLVLILASFLIASAPVIQGETESRIAEVGALQLSVKQRKADEEWLALLQQASESNETTTEDTEWTEEDEEMVNTIAREYELEMAEFLTRELDSIPNDVSFEIRSNAVRENILRSYSTAPDGSSRPFTTATEDLNSRTSSDTKKYRKAFSDNVDNARPVSDFGDDLKKDLTEKVKKNPSLKKTLKTKYASYARSWRTTATAKETLSLMGKLSINELSDELFKRIDATGPIESMVKNVGTGQTKALFNLKMSEFSNDLLSADKPMQEAFSNVSKIKGKTDAQWAYKAKDFNVNSQLSDLKIHIDDVPPSLDHSPMSEQKTAKAQKAVRGLNATNPNRAYGAVESLADFKYYFPGQTAADSRTIASKLSSEIIQGTGELASNIPRNTTKAASRARSFKALRGFRRIGGVLIGREASNAGHTNVNFTDIRWDETANGKLHIQLQRNDGQLIDVGTYSKELVHQALSYAADGRPIAVTMVNAEPFPFLKILLHPALIDTEVGCKAITIDRLVDTYATASDSKNIKEALERIQFEELLYRYACMKVLSEDSFSFELMQYTREFEQELRNKWSIINRLFSGNYLMFENPEVSAIAYRKNYFKNSILSGVQKAFEESNGRSSKFFENVGDIQSNGTIEEFFKVSTEQWSGVRELPYSIDEELSFLKAPIDQIESLYPLTFMRQIVYAPNIEDEDSEIDSDNPWEFPLLKKSNVINERVARGIRNNNKNKQAVKDMRDFTNLQRVFRAALEADFGYQFPVEKLHSLIQLTKPNVSTNPTPTWNSSGTNWNQLEVFYQSNDYSSEEIKNIKLLWEAEGINDYKNRVPCN